MLQFLHPWLFVLLPAPLLLRYLLPAYREPRLAVQVPFIGTLKRISGADAADRPAVHRRLRRQWLGVALVWLGEPLSRDMPMRDLLVALDLSGSMETRDFSDENGAGTARLEATSRQHAVPLLPIHTAAPTLDQIKNVLGRSTE